MFSLRRIFHVETVVFVNINLLSTSAICSKKKGLIRRPLRVWTPEQARKLEQGESENNMLGSQIAGKFPASLTNNKFTLPEGFSYVKLEDGDKRFK